MTHINGLLTNKHLNHTQLFTGPATKPPKSSSGLTLIELLIVMAIAAILTSIAIPSFNALYRTSQANAVVAMVNQALTFTRITALEQGKFITICPSEDQKTCSQQWSNPLITFNDTNNNQIIDGTEKLLRTTEKPSAFTLRWSAFGKKHYISYSPLGTINHTNGSLSLCPNDKNNRYGNILIINKGGRARLARDNDGTGVVDRASGGDLDCG